MHRKLKPVAFWLSCLPLAYIGFHLYSGGRTVSETVGLNLYGLGAGLIFGVLVPAIFGSPFLLFLYGFRGAETRKALQALSLFGLVLLTGCAVGEVLLERDERAFASEAAQETMPYMRQRAWPNQNAELIFLPGKGIIAND